MAELTPLYMDINSVFSGDELGLPYRDILGEGIVGAADLAVSEKAGGANLSVDIAFGAAWILGDTNPDAQPIYRVRNDAAVNKGISPDPSNPRKVLVIAQAIDETFAGTGRAWAIQALHGTPSGTPAEPALPASALPLALIDVTAADTSIVNAQITDRRVRAAIGGGQALGSTLPAAWTAYVPQWSSTGTQPVLGNGTITGRYALIGTKTLHLQITLTMGSTTTYGTGNFQFGLPFVATAGGTVKVVGTGAAYDTSVSSWSPLFARQISTTTVDLSTTGGTLMSPTVPYTWASGDLISLSATLELA